MGGEHALVGLEESVSGMMQLIENIISIIVEYFYNMMGLVPGKESLPILTMVISKYVDEKSKPSLRNKKR